MRALEFQQAIETGIYLWKYVLFVVRVLCSFFFPLRYYYNINSSVGGRRGALPDFLFVFSFPCLAGISHHVCVCVISSHSFWTSSSLDVPAGVTQEEGHTGFLIHLLSAVRALIFLARRIQPFLSLVDRKVEFCVLMI